MSQEELEAMIKEYYTGQDIKVELWEKHADQETEYGKMLDWMRKLSYIFPITKTQVLLKYFSQDLY